jgi:EAL domain-containing protein (putative c-di-GMP-specific phosphodiesterase class I)
MAVLFRREPSAPSGASRSEEFASTSLRPNDSQINAISQIIKQRLVTAEFQPIVRMATGETVGFESFARGPADSPFATPTAMFRAAAALGLTGELDLVAAHAAYTASQFSPQREAFTFFVNTDPAGLLQDRSPELVEAAREAIKAMRVVVEIPEQALVSDPIATLAAIDRIRPLGVRIALDNVGVSPQALALLPFLQPEVIKLSPTLLAGPAQRMAQVVDAVVSYTERSGSLLVAQGIEQETHLRTAVGTGAILGQGYLFGRPTTVPVAPEAPVEPLEVGRTYQVADLEATPYRLLAAGRTPTELDAAMLHSLGMHLLDSAEARAEPFVMIVVSSDPGYLAGGRAPKLRAVGHKASLLVVLTTNTDLVSTREVQVNLIDQKDGLHGELALALISPHTSSLLAARRTSDDLYECLLTHDRNVALPGALGLLRRATDAVHPEEGRNGEGRGNQEA